MLKPRPFLLLLLLLFGLQLTPLGAVAATEDDPAAESAPDPATQLKAAQKQLDSMKQLRPPTPSSANCGWRPTTWSPAWKNLPPICSLSRTN